MTDLAEQGAAAGFPCPLCHQSFDGVRVLRIHLGESHGLFPEGRTPSNDAGESAPPPAPSRPRTGPERAAASAHRHRDARRRLRVGSAVTVAAGVAVIVVALVR